MRRRLSKPAARWAALGALAASGLIAGNACREPTQLTVVLATDLDCSKFERASIYVGTPQEMAQDLKTLTPQGEATVCTKGQLGSIVVVPGNDENFAVRIVGRQRNSNCEGDAKSGCVEARRRLGFVPHTRLRMPVMLAAACLDVLCDNDKTCVRGQCVSSVVDPSQCVGEGCDESIFDAGAVDAPVIVDAPVVVDAASDVIFDAKAPSCVPLDDDAGPNTLLWHFEDPNAAGIIVEANGKVPNQPLAPGASFVPGPTNCGTALASDGGSQLLAAGFSGLYYPGFKLAFWLRTATASGTILYSTGNAGGWTIGTASGVLQASFCAGDGGCFVVTGGKIANGAWHHVEVVFTGGVGAIVVDSDGGSSKAGGYQAPTSPTVVVSSSGTVDELELTGTP